MLRTSLCGFLAGAILSAARVPLGFEPFAMPAVEAGRSYGVRAAAWIAIALALTYSRKLFESERRPAFGFLLGTTLGFAAHARFQLQYQGAGLVTPIASLVALAAGIALIARSGPDADSSKFGRRSTFTGVGLAVAGAGLAIAFEGVGRHGRLLTTDAALDESVLATVLLLSLAIGAIVFGPLFRTPTLRRIGLPTAAAGSGLLCCLSLRTIGQLAGARGWDRFVREYGMLSSHTGHGFYDLVLGGVLLTLPALALGTAFYCGRRLDWSALLFGGAVGLLSLPELIAPAQVFPTLDSESVVSSASIISLGAMLAAGGAILVSLSTRDVPRRARFAGASLALGALVATMFVPRNAVLIASPWAKMPVLPSLMLETAEGLLTVAPTGLGIEQVSLDQRVLSPGSGNAGRDAQHLEATFEFVPQSLRERGNLRVLLVGQLTPGRAIGLSRQSVQSLDRTAAWHESMPQLERHLFRDSPQQPLPGTFLAPDQARERYAGGHYDLVWIPLTEGACPIADLAALEPTPAGTTVVAWIDSGRSAAQRDLPERGIAVTSFPAQLAVALVLDRDLARFDNSEPNSYHQLELGESSQPYSLLEDLRLLSYQRAEHATAAFSRRLRTANVGGEFESFTAGLAHFHSIQTGSSPWATVAAATELDEETLKALEAMTAKRAPDRSERLWSEQLAKVLSGKRRIDWVSRYIRPLADRFGPWIELELTLLEADLEGLLFAEVLERLDELDSTEPRPTILRARALVGLGRKADAYAALAEGYRAGGQAREALRGPFAEILVREEAEHALEKLAELGRDLAEDNRLAEAIRMLGHEGDHHEH